MNEQVVKKIIETTKQHWGLDNSGAGKPQALKPVSDQRRTGNSQSAASSSA